MGAVSAAASVARQTVGAFAEALLIVAIVAALLVGVSLVVGTPPPGATDALAARGVISVPNGVYAGTTTATVNPGGTEAWARARCFQGGVQVYEEYAKVDANRQATFHLGPTPMWSGGSASCVGEEGYWSRNNQWRVLASTKFTVAG